MRLRSFLLLATLVAGAGGVALEFAARSAARDMAAAIEPFAALQYASAGIALDGSVRLREPRLDVRQGAWKGSVLARVADLRGGGPFWLVAHALGSGARLPAQMRIRTRGLHLGEGPAGVPLSGWLGTTDLALFENLGCGSDALSDKDRVRMGVETRERDDELRYQYDADAHSMILSMDLRSENIAAVRADAELTGIPANGKLDPAALQKLRLARISISYQDSGYLARRNQFCAQWLGVSAAQFIDRHIEAVAAFLGARGIIPGEDVLALYQRLATHGGNLRLTSLPDSSWVPVRIEAYPKEDLLRLLNITARYEDAPPIMLRLAFATPERPVDITTVVDPPVAVASTSAPDSTAAFAENGTDGESGASAAPAGDEESTSSAAPSTAAAPSSVQPPAASTAPAIAADNVAPADLANTQGERRIIASAPPPPKDSTLALVWKPGVIERLPPAPAANKEFVVVGKERLSGLVGNDILLVTENGKRFQGEVMRVSADAVVLSIAVARGNAELSVPLTGIREVRLRTRSGVSP